MFNRLNRLIGSSESVAKAGEHDEESILKDWKLYNETIPKKRDIISRLSNSQNFKSNLDELKKVLDFDLAEISDEEWEEADLIRDLESIEHNKKIKRVHRMEQCLKYVESKHEYVHGLLSQLHSVLKHELHLVKKLLVGSSEVEKLISHIKMQFELELEIIKKIGDLETFPKIFSTLAKGEHLIKKLDSKEKRLMRTMDKIMQGESDKGITHKWIVTVMKKIEDKFYELEAQGILDNHPDVVFQLANRPEFVDLVRQAIKEIRPREVSEQMINVFVHIFREWYNHERD